MFRKRISDLRAKIFGRSLKEMGIEIVKDRRGQSTTEYILILAIVVMIAMKFKERFSESIDRLTGKVTDQIDKAIDKTDIY